MKITFLGTGTSTGVPAIGCSCSVCTSSDPKDRRLRSSILVSDETGTAVIIDTGPDLREQCLKHNVNHLDGVLYTHAHMDHIAGLDDLRRFNVLSGKGLCVYASSPVIAQLKHLFSYAFPDRYTSADIPCLIPVEITHRIPFTIGDISITPLPAEHGRGRTTCFISENWAYCTDISGISPEISSQLSDLPLLILGVLRKKPHPKHFSFKQAVKIIEHLQPRKALLTHLGHDVLHRNQKDVVPLEYAEFAYDGMTVEI
jgi:phosphoribosyl 1,2-cyclic phosphate phosphodiesterase